MLSFEKYQVALESARVQHWLINKMFYIKILKFLLEAILTRSSEVTAQNIVDLFLLAMKVRQKRILCWYCYYKAYEDCIRDIKSVNNIIEG
jgi:hypothetical protein